MVKQHDAVPSATGDDTRVIAHSPAARRRTQVGCRIVQRPERNDGVQEGRAKQSSVHVEGKIHAPLLSAIDKLQSASRLIFRRLAWQYVRDLGANTCSFTNGNRLGNRRYCLVITASGVGRVQPALAGKNAA